MIQVTLGNLIEILMLAGIVLVIGWWLLAVWSDKRAENRRRSGMVRCRLCGCRYTDSEHAVGKAKAGESPVSRCPSCRNLNETGLGSMI